MKKIVFCLLFILCAFVSLSAQNVYCPLCNRQGKVVAQNQVMVCPICDGKKVISMERYENVTKKVYPCPNCSNGITPWGFTCDACHGKGRVTTLSYSQWLTDPIQPSSSNSNNSSTSASKRTGCRQCRIAGTDTTPGNGVCKNCKGTGTITGYSLERLACPNCDKKSKITGNGICKWCHGTGWR